MKNKLRILFLFCTLAFMSDARAQVVIDTVANAPNIPAQYVRYKNAIAVDPADNLWVGYSLAATKWDGISWTYYDSLNSGLPSSNVLSFAFMPGITWIGTANGLAKLSGAVWTVYDSQNSALQNDYIRCLKADGNNLWIGTNGGAYFFDGSTFTEYTVANSDLLYDTIQCIGKTSGAAWFGTSVGLSKFDGVNFTNYDNTNSVLYHNYILRLETDGNDNLWIQTQRSFPFNDLFDLYFDDGNGIHVAQENVTGCKGIPHSVYLIGIDHTGKVILANIFDYLKRQEIILLDMQGAENLIITPGYDTYFPIIPFPVSLRKFAVTSSDKIWMMVPNMTNTLLRDFYSLDYSAATSIDNEADCYQLDANKVLARINNNGGMFHDPALSSKYEAPVGSGKNSLGENSLWFGAKDPAGYVRTAAYGFDVSDFKYGPLDTVDASFDSAAALPYDNVWKVHADTIASFIYNFNAGNVGNGSYPVPVEMAVWPAHGSGNHSHSLAPFIDANNDGNYDPTDGDYPDVKGTVMLWWIFNDNAGPHLRTWGQRNLGIEIHAYAYAYNCPFVGADDSVINYTTFYHYDIYNRSDTNYTAGYAGLFSKSRLGNPLDDYIGCDSVNDFSFSYNGSDDDLGPLGYGQHPPMMNNVILRGPDAGINDSIDNNHNGVTDEPGEYNMLNSFMMIDDNNNSISGNPAGWEQFYSYMKAEWRHGVHLTYGGNGHGGGIGATIDSCNYMFSDVLFGNGWNEISAGNIPDYRQSINGTGPFYLPAHGRISLDYACVFTRNETGPNGLNTSFATNLHDVLKVKQWFGSNNFPCTSTGLTVSDLAKDEGDFYIYPNPASEKLFLGFRSDARSIDVEIMNTVGEVVYRNSFSGNNKEVAIDVNFLEGGIYFVNLLTEKFSSVKKVVIE